MAAGDPLVCLSCGEVFGDEERFCPRCELPLVPAEQREPRVNELRERARKVKPQYTEGPLVRVAHARPQPEAELIQGMLIEEGIPSMTRASMGFELPHYFPGGSRDVLVPSSAAQAARELLAPQDGSDEKGTTGDGGWGQRLRRALVLYLRR
jgi:hypothetical protein